MDEITFKLPASIYARLRGLITAGGKSPDTGENGLHAASQTLLMLDQQVEEQRQRAATAKPNEHDEQKKAASA